MYNEYRILVREVRKEFWRNRQIAVKAVGQTELEAHNLEELFQLTAQSRRKKFLQAMAKLHF